MFKQPIITNLRFCLFFFPFLFLIYKKNYYLCRRIEYYKLLIIKHKIQSMSKPIYFLPWAMRMVIILCLVITHIQQDSLVYILSALTLILIAFCIWGCTKSKTQDILKAFTGNRTQNIFDIVMSALFIIIGLYCKDTTTVIEGGALLTISVINIISPIKYQKSDSSV